MGPQDPRIEEHADGDEEEEREHVTQGGNVAQGPPAVIRFAEHEPGHEGPEGEREPEGIGQVADAQPKGRHGQDEEFLGLPARNVFQHQGDRPGTGVHHHRHESDHLQDRSGNPQDRQFRAEESKKKDHQGKDDDVLHDGHAEHDAARQGAELSS